MPLVLAQIRIVMFVIQRLWMVNNQQNLLEEAAHVALAEEILFHKRTLLTLIILRRQIINNFEDEVALTADVAMDVEILLLVSFRSFKSLFFITPLTNFFK
ncbi:unnamed protein product [Meloidogyne enterolobii]|uniref:Uncharacterized protein n=1 Tax=Meloidogyne enterolobii TaxID=390850 RepID=A0ACB0ZBQ4_MELEN